jgi:ketosteroid isomerase-like protein
MAQENLDSLARVYAGWERGDFTTSVALFDRHVTLVLGPEFPDGDIPYVGQDGVRAYMKRFLGAWDSLTVAAESLEVAGDTVVVRVRQTGVGRGSGAPVELKYFHLWTFRGGKVIRLESIMHEHDALEAAGLRE